MSNPHFPSLHSHRWMDHHSSSINSHSHSHDEKSNPNQQHVHLKDIDDLEISNSNSKSLQDVSDLDISSISGSSHDSSSRPRDAHTMKSALTTYLSKSGIQNVLKSQLRAHILTQFAQSSSPPPSKSIPVAPTLPTNTPPTLILRVAESLLFDFLKCHQYPMTASVLECEAKTMPLFTTDDVLRILQLFPSNRDSPAAVAANSPFTHTVWSMLTSSSLSSNRNSLLIIILTAISTREQTIASLSPPPPKNAEEKKSITLMETGSQTDPVSNYEPLTLEGKLNALEAEHIAKYHEQSPPPQSFYDARMAAWMNRSNEKMGDNDIEAEVKRRLETLVAQYRANEAVKHQRAIEDLTRQYERQFKERSIAISKRETELTESVRRREMEQENILFNQRQRILTDMESLRVRELDLRQREKLLEERERLMQESLQSKENTLNANLRAATEERATLTERINAATIDLRDQLQTATNNYESSRKYSQKILHESTERITSKDTLISSLKAELAGNQDRLESSADALTKLTKRAESLERECRLISDERRIANERSDSLASRLQQLENDTLEARVALVRIQDLKKQLEEQQSMHTQKVQGLQESFNSMLANEKQRYQSHLVSVTQQWQMAYDKLMKEYNLLCETDDFEVNPIGDMNSFRRPSPGRVTKSYGIPYIQNNENDKNYMNVNHLHVNHIATLLHSRLSKPNENPPTIEPLGHHEGVSKVAEVKQQHTPPISAVSASILPNVVFDDKRTSFSGSNSNAPSQHQLNTNKLIPTPKNPSTSNLDFNLATASVEHPIHSKERETSTKSVTMKEGAEKLPNEDEQISTIAPSRLELLEYIAQSPPEEISKLPEVATTSRKIENKEVEASESHKNTESIEIEEEIPSRNVHEEVEIEVELEDDPEILESKRLAEERDRKAQLEKERENRRQQRLLRAGFRPEDDEEF